MFSVIIPARYASSRLPGKVLLDIAGKTMLEHCYEHAIASGAERVYVATDSEKVAAHFSALGLSDAIVMTSAYHETGTQRVAEAARLLQLPQQAIIVGLQADEPMIPATAIETLAQSIQQTPMPMATLCQPLPDGQYENPHCVKVVCAQDGSALYFSRASIPYSFTQHTLPKPLQHMGIYAYRNHFLQAFVDLPPCDLERLESLEQLRALYYGHKIKVTLLNTQLLPGVDTLHDLELVRACF